LDERRERASDIALLERAARDDGVLMLGMVIDVGIVTVMDTVVDGKAATKTDDENSTDDEAAALVSSEEDEVFEVVVDSVEVVEDGDKVIGRLVPSGNGTPRGGGNVALGALTGDGNTVTVLTAVTVTDDSDDGGKSESSGAGAVCIGPCAYRSSTCSF
jgi:hypothetical protein